MRDITVIGVSTYLPSQVSALAGIHIGDSLLTIDRERVKTAVEADPRLEYQELSVNWPSGVLLKVNERLPCAYIANLSSAIILDKAGYVLRIDPALPGDADKLIRLAGVSVSTFIVGQALGAENPDQTLLFTRVYEALEAGGLIGEVTEITVSQAFTARIRMISGVTVSLGDGTQLSEKVRIMDGIMRQIEQTYPKEAIEGSTLDVSSGRFGDFAPASRASSE